MSHFFQSFELTFSFPLEINNPGSAGLPSCTRIAHLFQCSQGVPGESGKNYLRYEQ